MGKYVSGLTASSDDCREPIAEVGSLRNRLFDSAPFTSEFASLSDSLSTSRWNSGVLSPPKSDVTRIGDL
jgi:hypothetical protein